MFVGAALRAALVLQGSPILGWVLLILAAFLLGFAGNTLPACQSHRCSALLLSLNAILLLALLGIARSDFFGFLFAILIMQVARQYSLRAAALVTACCTVLIFAALVQTYGVFHALGMAIVFCGGTAFLAVYISTARHAEAIQSELHAVARELQATNRQLEVHADQQQQLAAGRERQRLARELHDSVTQTIFSMTMTTQSALLLLERDKTQVTAQLDRLEELAQSALFEMRTLIFKLAPEKVLPGGFIDLLPQHLRDRWRLENLSVSLEVVGEPSLTPAEEAALLGIAQEALNNVTKHAGVCEAALRLHLSEPCWMEIADGGAGFDPAQACTDGRMGLISMRERAAEIGWDLCVKSTPGAGTCVRVEKIRGGTRQK
jgi:signal transduction histidine kinase